MNGVGRRSSARCGSFTGRETERLEMPSSRSITSRPSSSRCRGGNESSSSDGASETRSRKRRSVRGESIGRLTGMAALCAEIDARVAVDAAGRGAAVGFDEEREPERPFFLDDGAARLHPKVKSRPLKLLFDAKARPRPAGERNVFERSDGQRHRGGCAAHRVEHRVAQRPAALDPLLTEQVLERLGERDRARSPAVAAYACRDRRR